MQMVADGVMLPDDDESPLEHTACDPELPDDDGEI